ncbi:MAG: acetate kinase, partial [Campylobacter ureolyticus]|nr:acetate kinase [Campylobacter ureolyticus]
CKTINHFGVNIDDGLNELKSNSIRFITKRDSVIRALVVPTNEELAIALEVRKLIKNKNFI